jgi:hypothetical protein
MPVKLQISGTRASIKIVTPIENRMNSMRPVQPQKGTRNPEHLQTNLPKSIVKKVITAKAE